MHYGAIGLWKRVEYPNRQRKRREAWVTTSEGSANSGAENCGKGDGRLAEAMRDSRRCLAIDGGVLDRGLRHFGGSGIGSVPSECSGDEEFAGAQESRPRDPMADEAARLWAVAEF